MRGADAARSSISTAARRGATLVNNYDWMSRFSYLDFLRDIGKNFPVNVMLAKDSVRSRLERSDSGLSYTEFSYMLLQAYDFVHLNRQFGCELQIGGSDQWGNITAGIDLARRMHAVQLYGMTCPLLTKSDGTKMGKTESGRRVAFARADEPLQVSINTGSTSTTRTSANACDSSPTSSAKRSKRSTRARAADPGRRESQRRLAEEITRLVHGEAGLAKAQRATRNLVRRRDRVVVATSSWPRSLPTSPVSSWTARRCLPG